MNTLTDRQASSCGHQYPVEVASQKGTDRPDGFPYITPVGYPGRFRKGVHGHEPRVYTLGQRGCPCPRSGLPPERGGRSSSSHSYEWVGYDKGLGAHAIKTR